MISDWTPSVCVGPFHFGSEFHPSVAPGLVSPVPHWDEGCAWLTYDYDHGQFRVHVADGLVDTVACYRECRLHGVNLIGMHIDRALKMVGSLAIPDLEAVMLGDEPRAIIDLGDVGAHIWTADGMIDAVFCSSADET